MNAAESSPTANPVKALDNVGLEDLPAVDWRPLCVILIGTFLIVLDFFIVNVALPSIQHDLSASPATLEWVVAGYGLSFAVLLITGGRLGDRFGRRCVFSVGVLVFMMASAACAVAPNADLLVVARLLQGVGAALISPNVLSIIGVLYTGPNRVKAITAYGMVLGGAATGGQVLGGLLIEANPLGSTWRTIFLINVPIGVAALLLARRQVPESKADRPSRLDFGGIVLATLALTALLLPLVEGRQQGWPAWTWWCFGGSCFVFVLLTWYERSLAIRGREPLVHPVAFRTPSLRVGLLLQVMCWCTQVSFFLVLALYLQEGRHLNPLQSGLVFTILASAFVAMSQKSPALTARYGRDLILAGVLTVAAGDLALWAPIRLIGGSVNLGWFVPGLALVGIGQAFWITPLTSTVLAHADPQRAGLISGLLSTMQQFGNALGVALVGIVYFDSLGAGYSVAFSRAVLTLAAVLVVAGGLTRMLPRASAKPSAARTKHAITDGS